MRFRAASSAALAALLVSVRDAGAQAGCAGHSIRHIDVATREVLTPPHQPFARTLQKITSALNWETRPIVVRRELRFDEGEKCDPAKVVETVRVLRSQPYIRSAVVTTSEAPGDSIDLLVQTQDEFALGGSIRIEPSGYRAFKALRITENNLFGRGMLAQMNYEYLGRHAGIVFDLLDRQFFGRTDAEFVGGKSSVGPVWEVSLRKVFESEYDKVGFRAAIRYREEPFNFSSSVFGSVVQPLVSEGFEGALIGRIGRRGRQLLMGVALSAERLFVTDDVFAANVPDDSAAGAALAGRFLERQRVAASLIIGARSVQFVPAAGIDAVHALEDVRQGFEFRAIVGRTIASGGMRQTDAFGLADLFIGLPLTSRTLGFLRAKVEGRWLKDVQQWDGIIAAVDGYAYIRKTDHAVLVLGAQAAGGWNMSTPWQLLVSSPTTMRGFGIAGLPAGRRVVVQAEHRYFLGNVLGIADAGSALFVDMGRGWAGDAPFGEDTGTLVSVGGGIRIAFPQGSRFTSRLDFAVPVMGGRGVELRATIRRQFGVMAPESGDVERSRLPISTINLFNFQRY